MPIKTTETKAPFNYLVDREMHMEECKKLLFSIDKNTNTYDVQLCAESVSEMIVRHEYEHNELTLKPFDHTRE